MIIMIAVGLTVFAATIGGLLYMCFFVLNTPTQDLYYPESKAFDAKNDMQQSQQS